MALVETTGAEAGATGDGGGVAQATRGGSSAADSTAATSQAGEGGDVGGCGSSPWVTLDGAVNARSLGGVALADGATVACGMLYRGGYLGALSEQGCSDFAALGVRTVIDLRSLSEQATEDAACVTEQAMVVSAPMPIPYTVTAAEYIADLYANEAIVSAMTALAEPQAYPIYFHCLHGRDRSGVLAAVILLALGASRDEVLREYLLTAESGGRVYPESLTAVLDEIDRIGGIAAYFETVGVDAQLVEAMKELLVVGAGS